MTAGYEFPYDGAQCVFIYNGNKVTSTGDLSLLQSINGIKTWIMNNPGKFTYPAPKNALLAPYYDYTGRLVIITIATSVHHPITSLQYYCLSYHHLRCLYRSSYIHSP